MTTIRSYMTDDHRRCDDLFADAEQAVGKGDFDLARRSFEHFHSAILAHFDREEKTLFPTFEAKTGLSMGPTQVMRMEHEQLRGLMTNAAAALAAGQADDYLGLADTLVIMMQQHNMKEENILYPMCDQHLSAELSAVLAHFDAMACPA
ncbi:MAG: hemerythrin protein [Proteobacteria bacterium]|nr:hemerythrin protein [Pseudomonadota bacterium]